MQAGETEYRGNFTMIKPSFLEPEDQPTVIGKVFNSLLVVKGWTGLPLLELLSLGIFTLISRHDHPYWSRQKRLMTVVLSSTILFGSEWCHNLAHAALADWIGKPVDAIRIFFGTPLLIYYDINDQQVSPAQHMLRGLGGPVFNALMLPLCWFARQFTSEDSLAHFGADFALKVNAFLATAAFLPIPGLDGGSLLKWSVVKGGRNPVVADEAVKTVNRFTGLGLAAATGIAIKKRHVWSAVGFALFGVISLAIGFGLLKEHE
jgi:Zn-dependent protease